MRDLVDTHYPDADLIRVVLDNLSTHTARALYGTFPAPEAHRILQRLEFHYTPKHARWLKMVEIEIGVLCDLCLDRRIGERDVLVAEIDGNPDGGPARQRDFDPAIRIMSLRRRPGRITGRWWVEHGFAHDTDRQERWRRTKSQHTVSRLTAPVPQQTSAEVVALGNLSEASVRHFSLRDNPQLLFRPPTMATLDTGDELHSSHCPTIFAALLRAPLEPEAAAHTASRN